MGLLDKLKNVFFEEEYVEVEEPVVKEKTTIAKKVENPEPKKEEKEEVFKTNIEENTLDEEDFGLKEPEKDSFRFPMNFDDNDFEVEKTIELDEPIRDENIKAIEKEEKKEVYKQPTYETPSYNEPVIYKEEIVTREVTTTEYKEPPKETREQRSSMYQGLYEGEKREKPTGFTPSPIISPIYGILNKNYKKEEIVTKKEIRLTATSNKKVDLDTIREKAYGDLANDITSSIEEQIEKPIEEKKEEKETKDEIEDLVYDLTEEESPTVKTVTVGDAEEYFNDLGLEYNVDYKVEKEEPKRRVDRSHNIESDESNKIDSLDEDDKNLFDLIDSMYEDK